MINSELEAFLEGTGFDVHGRYINDIFSWNFSQLEYCHDYIQWVFPLREPSRCSAFSPVVNDEHIEILRNNNQIITNMGTMLTVMEEFYKLFNYNDPQDWWWITPRNHNYLRLTRILKSLKIFGLDDKADEVFNELERIYSSCPNTAYIIGTETFNFWKEAVGENVHVSS